MMPAMIVRAQTGDFLTPQEEDRLRAAQSPSDRIEVYLDLAQARLEHIEDFRRKPMDPKYDNGAYLDQLLGQYIELTEELKNWIQDQYDRQADMRRGLRKLLETGPRQLEELHRIKQSPDAYAAAYGKSLREATDDLTDALDGAAKALGDQEKKFGELKREEKAAARTAKERAKEAKKQAEEEKKLRKKQQKKQGVPGDSDQN
jgi:uncharacterized phage infection (PIP) family protein YhgE